MTYGYICTNYRNARFTVAAVESLFTNDVQPSHIVVVDNDPASADSVALQALAVRHPTVEIISTEANVGYFAGLNIGIARLRELNSTIDWLVIGNNDLEFPQEFGATLEQVMPELAHLPVISPNIVTLDGLPQNPHVVRGVSRGRELVYDLYYANYHLARLIRAVARRTQRVTDRHDEAGHEQAQFIYQGHGAAYILTRRFFELLDALWAPTFLLGEEFFLSRQLAQVGERVYYEPRIKVHHHCNGAIGALPSRTMWQLARDAHRVYRQYIKPWHKQDGSSLPPTSLKHVE